MDLTVLIFLILALVILAVVIAQLIVRHFNLISKVDEVIKDKVVLKISVPIKNDKKALVVWGMGVVVVLGEMGEGGQKVQTSSYKKS